MSKADIPVVVITHNPSFSVIADHCITLSNGAVFEDILHPFALAASDIQRLPVIAQKHINMTKNTEK